MTSETTTQAPAVRALLDWNEDLSLQHLERGESLTPGDAMRLARAVQQKLREYADLAAERDRLAAEVQRLSEPEWYWDPDAECSYSDPTEAVVYSPAGAIVELHACLRVRTVFAASVTDEDDGCQVFDTCEAAQAALDAARQAGEVDRG